jgi:hypothetical protein
MLPILVEAKIVNENKLRGGTSNPLLITCQDKTGKAYSVITKVFSANDEQNGQLTMKEFLGNFYAKEFDLQAPQPFIVHFADDFIHFALDEYDRKKVLNTENRYFFGTKEEAGYNLYVPKRDKHVLKYYDKESVFAFDAMILQKDRRMGKPNLLVKGKDYLLIDHEISFGANLTYNELVNKLYWDYLKGLTNTGYKHIFQIPLTRRRKAKINNFETFAEYLKIFKPNSADDLIDFLMQFKIDVTSYNRIRQYLADLKNNATQFLYILQSLIS